MSNYSMLSTDAWTCIIRGASSWKMDHSSERGLGYRVYYPNGYGASIIKFDGTYGCEEDLWEVAVLKDRKICYDTPITNDVVGYLTELEVVYTCGEISSL